MARVFLSYSQKDEPVAKRLADALVGVGLSPVLDVYDADAEEDVFKHLLYSVHSSDFVLLLVPARSINAWRNKGAGEAIRYKLKSRNVSIVPVFLGRRPLVAGLADFVSFYVDDDTRFGRYDAASSIDRIARYLANLPKLRFDRLSPHAFKELVVALLGKLKFLDIERSYLGKEAFDIQAKTLTRNPFGGWGTTLWFIEVKLYKDSRADINSLSKLGRLLEEQPIGVNGVLITNGQLTSTAREWIKSNEESKRTSITVVDGAQLRELLLKYPDLVDAFFGSF